MNNQFVLEEHPKKKGTCPECGHKDVFRFYQDINGERQDDKYGRCDREAKCGYMLAPKSDKPIQLTIKDPVPEPQTIYPPADQSADLLKKVAIYSSNFHKLCHRLTIGTEHLVKWNVATDEDKTIFIHLDKEGKVTNAKWFKYGENGKRDKEFKSFTLKQPKPESHTRYRIPLYGEHLLDKDKKKIVCVVESEKTAVIASHFYPSFDWIACGAANGITDEKIAPLFGRTVYWLADADGNEPLPNQKVSTGGRRNSSLNKLKSYKINFEIIDLFPDFKDGRDICDAIIDGVKPEIVVSGELTTEQKEWSYNVPEGCDFLKVKDDYFKYSFIEYNNSYYYSEVNMAYQTVQFHPISNFVIKPLFLILRKDESKRIIEIANIHGVKKVLDIPAKAFISISEFLAFVEGQGNFLFNGDKKHFQKIKAKLYDQTKDAEEIRTLGYHKDGFYSFANGIFNAKFNPTDEHGIITHNKKNYFIPALSSIYKDSDDAFEGDKKFIYIKRDIKFLEWANLFTNVYKENGQLGICYYISSIFRDIIYKRFKFFPHLFLFGPPGTGKSTMAWSLSYMYGQAQIPFNLTGGTKVGFHRKFAQFINAMIWFDEYANSIDYARVQALKAAYDGTGHEKGEMTADNRTKTTPVHSGCIISGQELPIADNALFKRVVLLQYHQTEYSADEVAEFSRLQDMEQKGMSHITGALSKYRDKVESEFITVFEKTLDEFKKAFKDYPNIEERIIRNTVIPVTIFKILSTEIEFPFDYKTLFDACLVNIKTQNSLISSAKETNMFWDLVQYMLEKKEISISVDFKIEPRLEITVEADRKKTVKKFESTKRVLYLRLAKIHPLYMESHRRQYNKNGLDKGSLVHYLTNNKGFLGSISSTRFDSSNSSALAFDYDYLQNIGVNLDGLSTNDDEEIEPIREQPATTPIQGNLFINGKNEAPDIPI